MVEWGVTWYDNKNLWSCSAHTPLESSSFIYLFILINITLYVVDMSMND